jgi:hypothetical protein
MIEDAGFEVAGREDQKRVAPGFRLSGQDALIRPDVAASAGSPE